MLWGEGVEGPGIALSGLDAFGGVSASRSIAID